MVVDSAIILSALLLSFWFVLILCCLFLFLLEWHTLISFKKLHTRMTLISMVLTTDFRRYFALWSLVCYVWYVQLHIHMTFDFNVCYATASSRSKAAGLGVVSTTGGWPMEAFIYLMETSSPQSRGEGERKLLLARRNSCQLCKNPVWSWAWA
jgi:CDP-diglyceride synthetase